MADRIPKVLFTIDEDSEDSGMKAISLVDEPAIESDFIFFNSDQKTTKYIQLQSEEYEGMVGGLVLIPNKEILRVDNNGDPYYGIFTKDSIKKIRNKFHKELMTAEVNTDHNDDNYIDAFLVESYLIDTEERKADVEAKGIEEVEMGSWYVTYHIEDKETFDRVIDGELKGFSLEAYLSKIPISLNNNKNNFRKTMNDFILKLKNLVEEYSKENLEEQTTEEKFERGTIEGTDTVVQYEGVGEPVYVVTEGEEGEEILDPAPEGDHTLEDGRVLVVDADGNLVEIKEAPEGDEEAPEGDEEAQADAVEETTSEGFSEEEENKEEEVKAEEEEEVKAEEDGKKTIEELVDTSKDGWYTIEVGVEGGEITYGSVYSNTWKELEFSMEELEKLRKEKAELEEKVEKLSKNPIAKPVTDSTEKKEELEEVDESKLTNFEKIARRNRLPMV